MSTYQLLVAISSRLPQPHIGPQIKYKTEPRRSLHLDADSFSWGSRLPLARHQRRPLFHVHIEIHEVPAHGKSWFTDFDKVVILNTDQGWHQKYHKDGFGTSMNWILLFISNLLCYIYIRISTYYILFDCCITFAFSNDIFLYKHTNLSALQWS